MFRTQDPGRIYLGRGLLFPSALVKMDCKVPRGEVRHMLNTLCDLGVS